MRSCIVSIIVGLMIVMIGTCEAAIVTPPLVDSTNLTLRFSFDNNTTYALYQADDFEDGWDDWSWNLYKGETIERTTDWAYNGSYSVNITEYDDGDTFTEFVKTFTLPFKIKKVVVHYKVVENSGSGDIRIELHLNGNLADSVVSTTGTGSLEGTVDSTSIEVKLIANDYGGTFFGSVYYDYIEVYCEAIQAETGQYGFVKETEKVTGRYGYALSFDGEDYVRIPNPEEIRFPENSSFTVTVWYNSLENYPSGTGAVQYFLFKGGAGYFSIGTLDTGEAHFEWRGKVVKSTDVITDGEWHFIVGVRKEDGEGLLYVDGKLVASGVYDNGEVANTTSDLYIGQRDDGTYRTKGIIDEVRIYNHALSEDEIKAMYEALRIDVKDEVSGEEILPSNVSVFNFDTSASINAQIDNVTKDAILFHSDISSLGYGLCFVTIEASNYYERKLSANLAEETLIEKTAWLPPTSADIILETFKLEDYTGKFPPGTSILRICKGVSGGATTVFEHFFDAFGYVDVYLILGDTYYLVVYNPVTSEEKVLGYFYPASSATITIRDVSFPLAKYSRYINWTVFYDNSSITVAWETVSGTLNYFSVSITNESNAEVFSYNSTAQNGSITFIHNDATQNYIVHIEFRHSSLSPHLTAFLIPYNVTTLTGFWKAPVHVPEWVKEFAAYAIAIGIVMLFSMAHAEVGMFLSFAMLGFFVWTGWVRINPMSMIVLGVIVGFAMMSRWRKQA